MNEELCYWSAGEVAKAIRHRQVSPREVFEVLARRIEALNPRLNAFCTLALERAETAAQAATEALYRQAALGPLHGVPVAVKDDLAVQGLRFTHGSRLSAEQVAEDDDLTVTRLKQAGAIILGKTNLSEFGHKGTTENRLFGTTVNPWHPALTAGGSSGGSGAAVAAGLAYLALGTDIAGSIRIPASCCGIVGLKPSLGRIARVPAGNAWSTAWSSGPLTRTVADAGLALQVLAGPDGRDPFALPPWTRRRQRLSGLRLGWSPTPLGLPVDPEVAQVTEASCRRLETVSIRVQEQHAPLQEAPYDALKTVLLASVLTEAGLPAADAFPALQDQFSPTCAVLIKQALRITLSQYLAAQVRITDFIEHTAARLFATLDLLALPTLAVAPFSNALPWGPEVIEGHPIDAHLGWCLTWPFNLTGQPAISIPAGWTQAGLPVGLQLVGRRGADNLVLEPTFRTSEPDFRNIGAHKAVRAVG